MIILKDESCKLDPNWFSCDYKQKLSLKQSLFKIPWKNNFKNCTFMLIMLYILSIYNKKNPKELWIN